MHTLLSEPQLNDVPNKFLKTERTLQSNSVHYLEWHKTHLTFVAQIH